MSTEEKFKTHVIVNVEYCGVCSYHGRCLHLAEKLKEISNDFDVICKRGRQGSFEVTINDILIHSKLKTKVLPYTDEVVERAVLALEGKPISPIQQPFNCVIL